MPCETEKVERAALVIAFKFYLAYGGLMVLVGYGGYLWNDAKTKTVELKACTDMLPNAVVDCPLAAQVAECDAKCPWATCETSRPIK